jgi:methionyl-tRNA formyltransferase
MRVVFMGTPGFAVPSLKKLHEAGHEVVLVVTQPDRPAGRGRRVSSPPVKQAAITLGLPVEQHESVNCDEFMANIRGLEPEVIVVVAFGQILCQEILDAPSKAAINVHASLLPRYRGVAPINWAIVNGECETGVTIMRMARKVDAGEILLTRTVSIGERETAGELSDRLARAGAELLVEALEKLERGTLVGRAQDPSLASYARKLTRCDGEIDWSIGARRVDALIRGMTPWPGAYTWFRGRMLHIIRAEPGDAAGPAGEVLSVAKDGIEVGTGDGSIRLKALKPEGRSAMSAEAFARGYRPEIGTRPFGREE